MANNIILPGSGSSARGGSGAVSATGATASASAANPTSSASIGSASAASVSSAAGTSGNTVALSLRSALAVLCGGKVARVAAAFATFRFLRGADGSPLFFYLFCVVAGASAVLLSLQRPWSGRRIGAKRWRKVGIAKGCFWSTSPLCVSCSKPADACAFSSNFLARYLGCSSVFHGSLRAPLLVVLLTMRSQSLRHVFYALLLVRPHHCSDLAISISVCLVVALFATPCLVEQIAASGAMLAATLCAWVAGVKSCGPLRALLVDGAELPLLYASSIIRRRELPERRKTRGALLMLAAYALLVYDASGRAPGLADIEESPLVHRAGESVGALRHKTAEEISRLSAAASRARGQEQLPEQLAVRRRALLGNGDIAALMAAVDAVPPMAPLRALAAVAPVVDSTPLSLMPRVIYGVRDRALAAGDALRRLSRVQISGGAAGLSPWQMVALDGVPVGQKPLRRSLLSLFDSDIDGDGSGDGFFHELLVDGSAVRAELGVLLVLLASVLMQASRPHTRRLATELGGSKRQFSLSVTAAAGIVSLLAIGAALASSRGLVTPAAASTTSLLSVAQYATVGILWLVAPYYIRALVAPVLSQRTLLRVGVVVPFLLAAAADVASGGEGGGLSLLLIIAFFMVAAGMTFMVGGSQNKRPLSDLPVVSNAVSGAT